MRSETGRIGLRIRPEWRVFLGFALYAMAMGSIFPRLPEVMARLGVEEAGLGLGLLGTPAGTLVALSTAAPLLERVGFRRVLLCGVPLIALFYALAVHATSPLALFLLLLPVGLIIGCVEIVINVEADRTEALVGRRIMNRAHGFWSLGFFTAGLVGAGLAQLGLSPQLHLALVVPAVGIGVLVLLGGFEPAPIRAGHAEEPAPRVARPTWPILVLVAVTLSAVLMEGAGLDWSAIYMSDRFAADPFWAGLAVALVAGSQAVGRFLSDGFVERHSPVAVARAQLAILGVGLLVLVSSSWGPLSLLGFAALGFGTSAIFPLAMSAAAQRTDRPAPVNVAALAQFSFVAFLVGPPLLGIVAQHWGLAWVYGLGLPLVGLSLLAADALGQGQAGRVAEA